jgi:nitric oxide reductase NorD protein
VKRQRAVLIKLTRVAAQPLVDSWHNWVERRHVPAVSLESVRRRLEMLLTALYGDAIRIDALPPHPPAWRAWFHGFMIGIPRHLRVRQPSGAIVGETIRLPAVLTGHDEHDALLRYRLLALEQGARVARGTATRLPETADLLERDLYLLSEANAVDRALVRDVSGIAAPLASARHDALTRRPSFDLLTPLERQVERLARAVLRSGNQPAADTVSTAPTIPTSPALFPPDAPTPDASLAWARVTASILRAQVRGVAGVAPDAAPDASMRYRGLASVAAWGDVRTDASIMHAAGPMIQEEAADALDLEGPSQASPSSDASRESQESHESHESSAEHSGERDNASLDDTTRPDDQDRASVWENDEGASTAEPSGNATDGLAGRDATQEESIAATPAAWASVEYPEWDCNAGHYLKHGVTIRLVPPTEDASAWAEHALQEHAALVRQVRQRFERLRSRRIRLRRQPDGEELDLDACVTALVDRQMRQVPDDRLYASVRPARRALAIALLVDVSGSTDAQVTEARQVIDVEKLALLFASEALDALGDLYGIFTFSGHGAMDVRVTTIKDFAERNGAPIHRRIAAMAPDGNTRLGAAVRHATAQLARQPAGHRMLLILSDGKPNDTDRYYHTYAIEDSRQAILEARANGVFPFCLTVDRDEPEEYLSHIFGRTGHTILRHPDQLPLALLRGVRQLLGA